MSSGGAGRSGRSGSCGGPVSVDSGPVAAAAVALIRETLSDNDYGLPALAGLADGDGVPDLLERMARSTPLLDVARRRGAA